MVNLGINIFVRMISMDMALIQVFHRILNYCQVLFFVFVANYPVKLRIELPLAIFLDLLLQ